MQSWVSIIIGLVLFIFLFLLLKRLFRKNQRKAISSSSQTRKSSNIELEFRPERKRIQVASETVGVPSGVTIKVKRSRTVEHTVAIDWRASGNFEAGLQAIISASIRGEIERSLGRTYQETETTEYEVELNGQNASHYNLVWTDIWLTGDSSVKEGKHINKLPFEFRERSELEVSPLVES